MLGFYVKPLCDSISAAAIKNITSFDGQALGNTAWAFAALLLRDLPLIHAIATASLPKLTEFEATQNLSNSAWALSPLQLTHRPLLDAISTEAIRRMHEFVSQQLANTAWAYACLKCFDSPLSHAISSASLRIVADFQPTASWEDELLGIDLRGLAWAYSFSSLLDGAYDGLLRAAHARMGRALDVLRGAAAGEGARPAPALAGDDVPRTVFEDGRRSLAVIFKPPGWEVDDEGHVCGRQLSRYLQRRYPGSAIAHDLEYKWGILHRLDVPSSGLILAGTTFEGYYALKWQLDTARIAREYTIAVHGESPSTLCAVDVPVHHVKEGSPALSVLPPARSARRSTVCEMGKPALTWLRIIAHAEQGPSELSLVAARIRTGRRHQIRAHLLHVSCPTVADGKYLDAVVLMSSADESPQR